MPRCGRRGCPRPLQVRNLGDMLQPQKAENFCLPASLRTRHEREVAWRGEKHVFVNHYIEATYKMRPVTRGQSGAFCSAHPHRAPRPARNRSATGQLGALTRPARIPRGGGLPFRRQTDGDAPRRGGRMRARDSPRPPGRLAIPVSYLGRAVRFPTAARAAPLGSRSAATD